MSMVTGQINIKQGCDTYLPELGLRQLKVMHIWLKESVRCRLDQRFIAAGRRFS